jgi:hypothetical protein
MGTSKDEKGVRLASFYRNPAFIWNCHAAKNPLLVLFVINRSKLTQLFHRMNT